MPRRDRLGDALERDELIAEIDEGHPAALPAKLESVDDAAEEREHLVDVPHLDRDVVDADESRHRTSVAVGRGSQTRGVRRRFTRPDAGELDDRRGRSSHVLHARPLADRVVLLPAGEEVRRRQSLRREHGAVRPAAGDRKARLDTGPPDRLERRVDDARESAR